MSHALPSIYWGGRCMRLCPTFPLSPLRPNKVLGSPQELYVHPLSESHKEAKLFIALFTLEVSFKSHEGQRWSQCDPLTSKGLGSGLVLQKGLGSGVGHNPAVLLFVFLSFGFSVCFLSIFPTVLMLSQPGRVNALDNKALKYIWQLQGKCQAFHCSLKMAAVAAGLLGSWLTSCLFSLLAVNQW